MNFFRSIIGMSLLSVLLSCASLVAAGTSADTLPQPADVKIQFDRDIRPILETSCLRCHGPEKRKGGLLLTSRKDALLPADSGRAVLVPVDRFEDGPPGLLRAGRRISY